MEYYPAFLRLDGATCLVVGGGPVAAAKAATLLQAGGRVLVVSPRAVAEIAEQDRRGALTWRRRRFDPSDLDGVFLCVAATDDDGLHESIHRLAEARRVLLNVVDRPQWCSFIVPSIARRGDLTVAVSTAGKSPAFARKVRMDIEGGLGAEHERALVVLSRLREFLHERGTSFERRRRIFEDLLGSDFLESLRLPNPSVVDRLLASHAGEDVSLAALDVRLEG